MMHNLTYMHVKLNINRIKKKMCIASLCMYRSLFTAVYYKYANRNHTVLGSFQNKPEEDLKQRA